MEKKSKIELAKDLISLIFSTDKTIEKVEDAPVEIKLETEVNAKKATTVAAPVTDPLDGPINGPQLKDATLQSGVKVQYNEPLTVGDPVYQIAEDGTQTALADGTIEINETPITIKDGKIESIANAGSTDEDPSTQSTNMEQEFVAEVKVNFEAMKLDFAKQLEDVKKAYEDKIKTILSASAKNPITQAPIEEEAKPLSRMEKMSKQIELRKAAKHSELFKTNKMK
jgi:hypothetical protein